MTFRKNGYIPKRVHHRCNEAEGGTGGDTTRRRDSERDLVCATVCERDLRQAGEYMQESRSTPCVSTEEDIEESTHKGERATEACGQGSGVPNPLCTV